MNPVSGYLVLACAALLLLIGGIGGYWLAGTLDAATIKRINAQLAQANADTAVAVASVDATRTALGALKDKYAELQARHDAMRVLSQAELDARQSHIDQLQADAVKRQSVIVEKAREPSCADLARLPVCPAVAGQLWPAAAEGAGGEPAGNH